MAFRRRARRRCRSFGQALRDAYGALSWDAWVRGKLGNLDPLIGHWPSATARSIAAIFGYGSWEPAGMRWGDFFYLLSSLHAYSFALICALLLLPFLEARAASSNPTPCCAC